MGAIEPTAKEIAFADVWIYICAIARKDGSKPFNRLSGAYYIEAGSWELWINGTLADLPKNGEHPPIPRFNCYVKFNGWPAGFFDPHTCTLAAGGLANIFTLRDALKERAT